MALIWHEIDASFQPVPFGQEPEIISAEGALLRESGRRSGEGALELESAAGVLTSFGRGAVLMASRGKHVFVNGMPVHLGIRVLRDKDAIRVRRNFLFYTKATAAAIEKHSGPSVSCARCLFPIEQGSPAVKCPGCLVSCHQDEDYPCWTGYEHEPFATCPGCGVIASLGGNPGWSPALLCE